jgi:hypothetical protein
MKVLRLIMRFSLQFPLGVGWYPKFNLLSSKKEDFYLKKNPYIITKAPTADDFRRDMPPGKKPRRA